MMFNGLRFGYREKHSQATKRRKYGDKKNTAILHQPFLHKLSATPHKSCIYSHSPFQTSPQGLAAFARQPRSLRLLLHQPW